MEYLNLTILCQIYRFCLTSEKYLLNWFVILPKIDSPSIKGYIKNEKNTIHFLLNGFIIGLCGKNAKFKTG